MTEQLEQPKGDSLGKKVGDKVHDIGVGIVKESVRGMRPLVEIALKSAPWLAVGLFALDQTSEVARLGILGAEGIVATAVMGIHGIRRERQKVQGSNK